MNLLHSIKDLMNCQEQELNQQLINMSYLVHNLREGSRTGNWLRYWENATGIKAGTCHKIGCAEVATDGAHVQLSNSINRNWYIVPLCHRCNCRYGEQFFVKGPLVSVTDPDDILW